jgi:hypothetical protein
MVWGLTFRVQGLGSRIYDLEFRTEDFGLGVSGLWFRFRA